MAKRDSLSVFGNQSRTDQSTELRERDCSSGAPRVIVQILIVHAETSTVGIKLCLSIRPDREIHFAIDDSRLHPNHVVKQQCFIVPYKVGAGYSPRQEIARERASVAC